MIRQICTSVYVCMGTVSYQAVLKVTVFSQVILRAYNSQVLFYIYQAKKKEKKGRRSWL